MGYLRPPSFEPAQKWALLSLAIVYPFTFKISCRMTSARRTLRLEQKEPYRR